MIALGGHILDSIVNIIGDIALMWMIKDDETRQEDRMLQSMNGKCHEVVAFSLMVQN